MAPSTMSLLRVLTLLCGLSQMMTLVLAADEGGVCLLPCMQGKCTTGNSCECNPGWANLLNTSSFPCVVPNCLLASSCGGSIALPPVPPPPPPSGIPNLCNAVNCGPGTCVPVFQAWFRCDCNPGYGNLMNVTAAPCVEECSVSATCTDLGLPVGQVGAPPPKPLSSGNSTTNQSPSPPSSSLSADSKNSGHTEVVRISCVLILTIISIAALI